MKGVTQEKRRVGSNGIETGYHKCKTEKRAILEYQISL